MTHHRSFTRHLPVFLALLAIGGIFALISDQTMLRMRGGIPVVILALVILLFIAVRSGRVHFSRTVGLLILGVVTLAEVVAASLLVANVLTAPQRMGDVPHAMSLVLLGDAALIWVLNVLTFSIWYWEIDGGGPARRHFEGYVSADFLFPQTAAGQPGHTWLPHYVDYLFLAFTASTAFSPTDTLVLSVRAKLLMMTQAIISLTVLAILAARAINTL